MEHSANPGPNGEGFSPFPYNPEAPWDLIDGVVGLEDDMLWYVGCMHMAAIMLDQRYPAAQALEASQRGNECHMRGLGRVLCDSGDVQWWRWPALAKHDTDLPSAA